MITAILGLVAANAGALTGGVALGGALELAIPWMTRAHRARKVMRGIKAAGGNPPAELMEAAKPREKPAFRPFW